MSDLKLRTPRLRVVMDDGTEHDVQALNADLLAWDRTRARHGWPSPQDAQTVWATFLAWSALTRSGDLPDGMTLREFETRAYEVSVQSVAGINVSDSIATALADAAGEQAANGRAPAEDADLVSPIPPGLAPG